MKKTDFTSKIAVYFLFTYLSEQESVLDARYSAKLSESSLSSPGDRQEGEAVKSCENVGRGTVDLFVGRLRKVYMGRGDI